MAFAVPGSRKSRSDTGSDSPPSKATGKIVGHLYWVFVSYFTFL